MTKSKHTPARKQDKSKGYTPIPNEAWRDARLTPMDLRVYMSVLSRDPSFASRTTMAKEIHASLPTVKRSLRRLAELGYLVICARPGDGERNGYLHPFSKHPGTRGWEHKSIPGQIGTGSWVTPPRGHGRPSTGVMGEPRSILINKSTDQGVDVDNSEAESKAEEAGEGREQIRMMLKRFGKIPK